MWYYPTVTQEDTVANTVELPNTPASYFRPIAYLRKINPWPLLGLACVLAPWSVIIPVVVYLLHHFRK